MVIMSLEAMVTNDDHLLKSVIYTSERVGLLVDFLLGGHCKSRLNIDTLTTLITYEIHFQLRAIALALGILAIEWNHPPHQRYTLCSATHCR